MLIVKTPGMNAPGRPKGCEEGCFKVLECLKSEIYSSEKGKPIEYQKLDLEHIHVDNKNVQEAQALIYKNARESFELQDKVIFLGGDHSISYPCVKGFFEVYPNGGLIVFDAHPDCMPPMKEPTHEEWLRKLIEEGFPAGRILLIGLRNSDEQESLFIREQGIKTVSMNQLLQDLEGTTDFIMEFSQGQPAYVSLDIDVVDPAFAPGTGYQEPGGISSRQMIYIMQRIAMMKNVKGFDLVEMNPKLDDSQVIKGEAEGKEYCGRTVKLGARILAEML